MTRQHHPGPAMTEELASLPVSRRDPWTITQERHKGERNPCSPQYSKGALYTGLTRQPRYSLGYIRRQQTAHGKSPPKEISTKLGVALQMNSCRTGMHCRNVIICSDYHVCMQESRTEGYPFAARYFIARGKYVLGQRITDWRTWSRYMVLFEKA
jgi:hypothetical protein